ncbi:SusF/SusE family outer membrane protein [Pedobacter frigidisoli]|uniref:SusF/SusE family outer membrane protein n=1 Tax=Pedobacter frigidisoli TaxID=2530455 RepID=A0A4R0P1L9_9SPHI|nr:SusE domain-containing protein [Pedobacter frigidisoli]TCD10691.1 SusF/SusE family outer membrane protein [Pedobacter frigidisoli]
MKSIFLKSLALGLITLSLWSCKKDETQIVSNVSPTGTLTASATALSLVQSNGAKPALTFTYPLSTSTGYVVPVATSLQFDLKGNNFITAKEFVVSSASYSPTVNDFNTMLLALGAKIGTSAQVEVRLKSGAAANAMTYSNVVTLTATPYLASAWIYVPGNYQGWNPATADSLVSLTSNGIYTGIIKFDGSPFKITPAKKWDVAYGDAGAGTISTSGGDISSMSAEFKLLTVDLNKKTYTIAKADYWSIIGNAVPGSNWAVDTDMKFINDGKGSWSITTPLTAGELKFRLNHDWATSIGEGSGNIVISTAGTYKLTLTVNTDGKTGTYTAVKQ